MRWSRSVSVRQPSFVVDGRERAWNAMILAVRHEVETEYAERLTTSAWLGKWFLRRAMNRELRRRLEAVAPPDALY